MTRKIGITALLSLSIAASSFGQTLHSNIHLGLAYPLSTNGTRAAEYSNNFSAHAISGVSYSETGFCGSGFASIIKDSAKGFVGSGFATIIGNKATGMQAAGFINYVRNATDGFQAAGFVNITACVRGAQAAGFANIATGDVDGAQLAGFTNTANNANVQVAGFVNVAGDVSGTQIAGFINVARKVKGSQIAGFINIADSCDYPIGLVNIIGCGEKSIGVMIDETLTPFVTFRSGGRVLYGIIGIGFNGNDYRTIYAAQAGIGAHLFTSHAFRLNGEVTHTTLTNFQHNTDFQSSVKLLPSLKIGPAEIYAGPSFNYALSIGLGGAPFDHHAVWSDQNYRRTHEFYIGANAGVQFRF